MREMYEFDFGHPIPIQEHNLRTYLPRPLPTETQWAALTNEFGGLLEQPRDYPTLVRRRREARRHEEVERALTNYVRDGRPFALGLAQRLLETPADPLAAVSCRQAVSCLQRAGAAEDWAIAAALVADFGDASQQQALLNILKREPRGGPPSARYQAVVRGVANRYTPNRVAFIRPLLDDERLRVEPEALQEVDGRRERYRYCDTAVARLCTILDRYPVYGPGMWEQSRQQFLAWFARHPEAETLVRLGEAPKILLPAKRVVVEDRDDYRR
jgi:hypothetical protein